MKKLTKTIMGVLAICFTLIAVNACQEDVYPNYEPQELATEKTVDAKGETEDGDKDEGIIPK